MAASEGHPLGVGSADSGPDHIPPGIAPIRIRIEDHGIQAQSREVVENILLRSATTVRVGVAGTKVLEPLDFGSNGVRVDLIDKTLNEGIGNGRTGKTPDRSEIDRMGLIGKKRQFPSFLRNFKGRRFVHLDQGHPAIRIKQRRRRGDDAKDVLSGQEDEIKGQVRGEMKGGDCKAPGGKRGPSAGGIRNQIETVRLAIEEQAEVMEGLQGLGSVNVYLEDTRGRRTNNLGGRYNNPSHKSQREYNYPLFHVLPPYFSLFKINAGELLS
jgi:hypothetical protein